MTEKYEMMYDDDYLAKNFFPYGQDHGLKGLLKEHLDVTVEINNEGFYLKGSNDNVNKAVEILTDLTTTARTRRVIDTTSVRKAFSDKLGVQFAENATDIAISEDHSTPEQKQKHAPREHKRRNNGGKKGHFKKHQIRKQGYSYENKTDDQAHLVEAIKNNDIVFATGPAGTGKTHVAVAKAVEALENGLVEKLILARPAVSAKEDLGFLPGTKEDKIAPYMQPLYDELDKVIGRENRGKLMQEGIIEIVPIGMLRGRTFNDAVIIVDEAQNATEGQMKMALSRTGTNSKIIVAGDQYQVDLPRGKQSGLIDAMNKFAPYADKGVGMVDLKKVMRSNVAELVTKVYGDDKGRPETTRTPQAKRPSR